MSEIKPFIFYTRLHLTELTGIKACSIDDMRKILDYIPGSSVYHHTHRFLQQHQYASPEPPNDFAYWVKNSLSEDELAERLSSINIIEYDSINGIRTGIASVLNDFAQQYPVRASRVVNPGDEFYFLKSVSFIFPSGYSASDTAGLADGIERATTDSLYFHIFESRLRLEKGGNDISAWIEENIGNIKLAQELKRFDPYTHTMEELRGSIVRVLRRAS
ncbi:MAG: DUF5752 family protein [Spirochaetia bacterium]|nr:DUF5752 family protein [Spirochaetia bacterium]